MSSIIDIIGVFGSPLMSPGLRAIAAGRSAACVWLASAANPRGSSPTIAASYEKAFLRNDPVHWALPIHSEDRTT
jgi:hypothetical protein